MASSELAASAVVGPGVRAAVEPEPVPLPCDGRFERRILSMLFQHRSAIGWMLFGAGLEALLGLVTPYLSAKVVDEALPQRAVNLLAIMIALVVLASLHLAWSGWLRERIMISLSARLEATCLESLLQRFLRARLQDADGYDYGSLNETLAAASGATAALIRAAVGFSSEVARLLLMLGWLSFWFPGLVALVLLSALMMWLLSAGYALREAALATHTLETSSRQQQLLHVLLRGVSTLRVGGATERGLSRWRGLLLDHAHASITQRTAGVAQEVVFAGFSQIVWAGATLWLAEGALSGRASLGEMLMGVTMTGTLMGAFVNLATTLVQFQTMRPQFDRVEALLSISARGDEQRRPFRQPVPGHNGLCLEGVFFRYGPDGRWVLQDCTRSFPAGTVSELRAASGAGKTTLLRLLAGLNAPERGSVRVLGLDPHVTTGLVTYLPQRASLLEASIATNLTVLSGQPLAECMRVAALTGLDRLLARLPMGVETIVSMAGGNLSSGQCQLVLLTAAFARGTPVLLLDEATSQLDAESEAAVDWKNLVAGKTVLVVRHD